MESQDSKTEKSGEEKLLVDAVVEVDEAPPPYEQIEECGQRAYPTNRFHTWWHSRLTPQYQSMHVMGGEVAPDGSRFRSGIVCLFFGIPLAFIGCYFLMVLLLWCPTCGHKGQDSVVVVKGQVTPLKTVHHQADEKMKEFIKKMKDRNERINQANEKIHQANEMEWITAHKEISPGKGKVQPLNPNDEKEDLHRPPKVHQVYMEMFIPFKKLGFGNDDKTQGEGFPGTMKKAWYDKGFPGTIKNAFSQIIGQAKNFFSNVLPSKRKLTDTVDSGVKKTEKAPKKEASPAISTEEASPAMSTEEASTAISTEKKASPINLSEVEKLTNKIAAMEMKELDKDEKEKEKRKASEIIRNYMDRAVENGHDDTEYNDDTDDLSEAKHVKKKEPKSVKDLFQTIESLDDDSDLDFRPLNDNPFN